MKRSYFIGIAALAPLALISGAAMAQSNPFAPQNNGGLTKQQVEEIARNAAAQANAQNAGNPAPGSPTAGVPDQPGNPASGLPNGSPVGSAGGTVATEIIDPVSQLMSEEGVFVGCVRNTPIFKDKFGRRVYFTTKELKNSEAAKRFTRC